MRRTYVYGDDLRIVLAHESCCNTLFRTHIRMIKRIDKVCAGHHLPRSIVRQRCVAVLLDEFA